MALVDPEGKIGQVVTEVNLRNGEGSILLGNPAGP
jgi:hypothetical protein